MNTSARLHAFRRLRSLAVLFATAASVTLGTAATVAGAHLLAREVAAASLASTRPDAAQAAPAVAALFAPGGFPPASAFGGN